MLTRHGRSAARLVPATSPPDERARRALIDSVRAAAKHRIKPGPTAARSQNFLHDDGASPGDRRQHVGLTAVLLDEPEAGDCADAPASNHSVLISAATVAEALIVAQGCNARRCKPCSIDSASKSGRLALRRCTVRRTAMQGGAGASTPPRSTSETASPARSPTAANARLHFGTGAGQDGPPSASEREGGRLTDGPRMS